jgi:hypothetical protein
MLVRWPGIFIPGVPPKKPIGNTGNKFLEERRVQLQRFLQEFAKTEFLVMSKEF